MTNKVGNKKNTYTMWVTTVKNGVIAPVRYEMYGYDTLLGSHYDKYYLNYSTDSYKTGPGAVPSNKFDPERK